LTSDRAEAEAWSIRMEGFGGPAQPSPTIAQCLNGGYGWLQVMCHRCQTRASLPLDAIRRPRDTPIWRSGRGRCVRRHRGIQFPRHPRVLEYAKGEAAALITDHPDVAMAIADALVEHGILTGEQVDSVIESAMAREYHMNIELRRRASWRSVEQNAADFGVGLES
jgi:hypothetical protein